MGKGRTTIQAPDPINPGQAQGEYLFGQNFTDFQGVTDPRLQSRLIASERAFRPQYTALELADIQTLAQGTQAGQANPEYQRIQQELAGLRAGDQVAEAGASAELQRQYEIEANAIFPEKERENRDQRERREEKIQKYINDKLENPVERNAARAERIATLEAQLASTPQTLEGTPGLFGLLGDASRDAAELQREQLGLQREADVAALREFSPQVVDAYRRADPSSANLAQLSAERAGDFSIREQDLKNSVEAFNSITRKLLRAGENANSPQFQDSLTDGEAYYLYQAGLINADKSPKKRFTADNLRDEVIKADTDIQSIQAGTFQPDPSDKIGAVGETLLGRGVQDASDAERTVQARGQADAFAAREAATDAEKAIRTRGTEDIFADREAATTGEQRLRERARLDTFAQREAPGMNEKRLAERARRDIFAQREGAGIGEQRLQERARRDIFAQREGATAGERALQARGLANLGSGLGAASIAERAIQARSLGDLNARLQAASGAEQALAGRGLADAFARREAASAAERQLQQMGSTLGDLSPTEQEALISGRGSEFIQSTGELTPLELRRAQQAARQASVARGRGLGQGALADEIANRFAQETNKREREIALGAQLLGQEASMRGTRLGQGAGLLQDSEGLAAQRRAEQLQRQMFGSQNLAQAEGLAAQRRAEQFQRQQAGLQGLGLTDDQIARRMQQQLQRQMFGAQNIEQAAGLAEQRRAEQLQRQQTGVQTTAQAEALAAQRRAEQLQRQQTGIATTGQAAELAAQRRAEQFQRQQAGVDTTAQSEALAAQRRAEELQRRQTGIQTLGLADDMESRRRAEQFQRQQAGVGTLGLAEQLAARRRGEDIQGIQLGAGLIGQQQGLQSNRLGQAFDMSRSLSGDLGNIILGRPSSAIRLGQQTLGQAQAGAAGPMGPQLFDPNVGINMALQNQANQFGLLGAQAQADATRSAGGLGFAGGILGGILSRP